MLNAMPDAPEALVLRVDARGALLDVGGLPVQAQLRGTLFQESTWATRPVAVGDRVRVEGTGSNITISEVLPRRSQLLRAAAGAAHRAQVVAANIDAVAVVASVGKPGFSSTLADRVLAGAAAADIPGILIINKIDDADPALVGAIVETYRKAKVEVWTVSAKTGEGVAALAARLKDRSTLVTGLSGVGKTALINALVPGGDRRVGHLSWKWNQGKHTTTASEWIRLPGGGSVVDTPGVRGFVPWGVHRESLRHCFPDLDALIGKCKFSNCQHSVEPGCVLKEAVDAGTLARTRVASYLEMLEDMDDPPEEWSEGARPAPPHSRE
jgi:ribosome biogenesis GTPase